MKRIFTAAALLALVAAVVSAQETAQSLTLEAALQSALAKNAALQQSAVSLEQARRNKEYGWNIFLPSLSSSIGLSNTHTLFGGTTGASKSDTALNATYLSLTESVTFAGDLPTRFKLLDNSYRNAAAAHAANEQSLVSSVSTTFYSLIAAKMNIAILQSDIDLKKAQYDQAASNYKKGLDSELTMLRAQLAWQNAGPALDKAQASYRQDFADFLLKIGMDPAGVETLTLEGAIEIRALTLPPAAELAGRGLAGRSDVRTQEIALEQARLNLSAKNWAMVPTLTLSEKIGLTQSGSLSGSGQSAGMVGSGTFSVAVSLPIQSWIPGASDALARQSGREAVALAEAALENTRKSAEQDVFKQVDALTQALAALESSELSEKIAVRAAELSAADYRQGKLSQTELQSADKDALDARQNVVEARLGCLTAAYNLASALNMSIDELYAAYGKQD